MEISQNFVAFSEYVWFLINFLFKVGNQDAYEDIDNQRKTEKSYHFATSASDFEDEAETEVDETVQPEVSDDPVIPTDEENIVK